MSVLVTGGAGFIGSHLAGSCARGGEVRVLDDFSSGSRSNLRGVDCEILEGSILDAATVEAAVRGMDVVFHLAALVSVPASCERPVACVERNVIGLLNVLRAAVRAGVGTFVFASSAAVYGDDPRVPKTEDMAPRPRSPYAVTKLDGETYCDLLSSGTAMRTVSLRFFNVFGPRQDPRGSYAAAIPRFIGQALRNDPITLFGDGGQTRDFVPVADIVSAMLFAARNPAVRGVFNCGHGAGRTIRGLAERIRDLAGSTSPIIHAPERPGDIRHSVAAVDRLLGAGWRPEADFDLALAETIAWSREGG